MHVSLGLGCSAPPNRRICRVLRSEFCTLCVLAENGYWYTFGRVCELTWGMLKQIYLVMQTFTDSLLVVAVVGELV